MKCLACGSFIPVPDNPRAKATCPHCHMVFMPKDDYGWWDYSAVVYEPIDDDEGKGRE